MGFLTPRSPEDDERQPGGSGLHLDTEPQRCPSCRTEVDPWAAVCPSCGEVPVPVSQLPGATGPLPPGLAAMAEEVEAELAGETEAELAGETEAELAGETEAKLAGETEAKLAGETEAKLAGETEAKLAEETEAADGDADRRP